jgi:hypothetical protein
MFEEKMSKMKDAKQFLEEFTLPSKIWFKRGVK